MKFLDCYTGWPGSVHDARVLRSSPLRDRVKDIRAFQEDNHLLGDAVYPLTQWLLTPYKDYGTTNRAEQNCSYHHSAIERAFAILKGHYTTFVSSLTMTLRTSLKSMMSKK